MHEFPSVERFPPLFAVVARNNFECLVFLQLLNPFVMGHIQRHRSVPHPAEHPITVPFHIFTSAHRKLVPQIVDELTGMSDFRFFFG